MVELIRENNIGYFFLLFSMTVYVSYVAVYLWKMNTKQKKYLAITQREDMFIRLCQSSKDLWHSKNRKKKNILYSIHGR